jgi:hypothetical protein
MTRRRFVMLVAIAIIVIGTLAYLRDPPWLLTTTSGLGEWQADAGTRFRWMGGACIVLRAIGSADRDRSPSRDI